MSRRTPSEYLSPADLEQEPIERAETIPSSWYNHSEIFEFEKEAIFARHWQLACHVSQVRDPGDMATLEVAGNPLLVVRDKDGNLRAFYNVCRHRGGPLAVKKGTTSVLQCQYHGWTYLLDGSLRGIPQWDRVELFDKKDFGLKPVALECWQGLVFVSLEEGSLNLEEQLNGISNRIDPIDLSVFEYHSTASYQIRCNWKVYVDNYLEGYHIPIVHPELAKLLDYRQYETETREWYSLQHSPFQSDPADSPYRGSGDLCEGEAYYYFIFPNIMLNILPGRLQTNVVRPISETETEVLFHYYYSDVKSRKARSFIEEDISYSDDIQQEDIEICERVQKGLQSRGYDRGRFSVERELGVYHFQTLLKREFRRALKQ